MENDNDIAKYFQPKFPGLDPPETSPAGVDEVVSRRHGKKMTLVCYASQVHSHDMLAVGGKVHNSLLRKGKRNLCKTLTWSENTREQDLGLSSNTLCGNRLKMDSSCHSAGLMQYVSVCTIERSREDGFSRPCCVDIGNAGKNSVLVYLPCQS